MTMETPPTSDEEQERPAKRRPKLLAVRQCRSCRADIVWAETEAKPNKPGRKIPLDADPDNHGWAKVVPNGNLLFTGTETGDGTPIVRYVPKQIGRHVTHFATCPNAKKHRKTQ